MASARVPVRKTGDVVESKYRIIKTLGEGVTGTMFLAEHVQTKRRVAIKLLHREIATDPGVVEKYLSEARAAGTLGHPNIVEAIDVGVTQDGLSFIVFEYLEGTLLTDEIYRLGGLPVRRAVGIAEQIASAMLAAHHAGIIHRGLKSDNVFLTNQDAAPVKVLDFGVSRFTKLEDRQKAIVETPEFMAPEQITRQDSVDKRADIYALGVILYEMLTARRPFSNEEDPRALMRRIVTQPPPPLMRPEVPDALSDLILTKLLAKNPEDRYQSMADVEPALAACVTGSEGPSRRRSQAVPVIQSSHAETEFDVNPGETAASIPQLSKMAKTPGAVDTIDTPEPAHAVTLGSQARAKRPYVLYGMAGISLVIGVIGLVVGLRSGDRSSDVRIVQLPPLPPAPAVAVPAPREVPKIAVQLEADAPGARVVFRRRVTPTPTTMQLAPSDIVELVEVSAPGFKSQRYWLTFDRPTHLRAHLEKGTGSVEASEEDTLVALGEVTVPRAPAIVATTPRVEVAAASKVVAAKPLAPPPTLVATPPPAIADPAPQVAARTAPRKIGRAAAEAAPAIATSAPSEPPLETPVVPVAADPVKTEPANPEPAKVEPTLVVSTPPLQEPVRPQTMPEPVISPIDNATVSSVVTTHRPEVLKCFAEGKKKDRSMRGTLALQLQIDVAGKVHRVQVQSTLNAPLVAACVVRAVNNWKFPARLNGELATVTYPFTVN